MNNSIRAAGSVTVGARNVSTEILIASLWSTKQVAQRVGCKEVTVRSWRRGNLGPPYIKISARQVKYRSEDVERWLENQTHNQTAAV
jgi:predicted DNA-binding transcriptional regulator AlpA